MKKTLPFHLLTFFLPAKLSHSISFGASIWTSHIMQMLPKIGQRTRIHNINHTKQTDQSKRSGEFQLGLTTLGKAICCISSSMAITGYTNSDLKHIVQCQSDKYYTMSSNMFYKCQYISSLTPILLSSFRPSHSCPLLLLQGTHLLPETFTPAL